MYRLLARNKTHCLGVYPYIITLIAITLQLLLTLARNLIIIPSMSNTSVKIWILTLSFSSTTVSAFFLPFFLFLLAEM